MVMSLIIKIIIHFEKTILSEVHNDNTEYSNKLASSLRAHGSEIFFLDYYSSFNSCKCK